MSCDSDLWFHHKALRLITNVQGKLERGSKYMKLFSLIKIKIYRIIHILSNKSPLCYSLFIHLHLKKNLILFKLLITMFSETFVLFFFYIKNYSLNNLLNILSQFQFIWRFIFFNEFFFFFCFTINFLGNWNQENFYNF